jgi:hypothetical protein
VLAELHPLINLGFVISSKTTQSLHKKLLKHILALKGPMTKPKYSANFAYHTTSKPSRMQIQKQLKLVLTRLLEHQK